MTATAHALRPAARERRRTLEAWCLIVAFCIAIATPALLQVAGLTSGKGENRTLAAAPGWPTSWAEVVSWPQRTQSFLSDRFGLRSQMVWLNSLIRYRLDASTSTSVAIGTNGFLYYAYEPERLMQQHTGEDVFTPKALAGWIDAIAANRAWLAARGIAYYVIVAPDKSTIYPEYLPDYPPLPGSTTRLDQIVGASSSPIASVLIDPRAAIMAQKPDHRMYPRADSHWGPRAAFVAYSQLMERVRQRFPSVSPVTLDDYEITQMPSRGDLAFQLNLYDDLQYPEDYFKFRAKSHVIEIVQIPPRPSWGWPIEETRTDLTAAPKLLVLGDSFTHYVLGPIFLSQTFRDPTFVHHNGTRLDKELIETARPDIVVHEFAERYLSIP